VPPLTMADIFWVLELPHLLQLYSTEIPPFYINLIRNIFAALVSLRESFVDPRLLPQSLTCWKYHAEAAQ
jgi:hypothetical protein